jgi:hypothetical protein
MKRILMIAVVAAMATAAPTTLSAKSKFFNAIDSKVDVRWVAIGCGGIETTCDGVPYVFICKRKTLKPGESGSYSYKGGTSKREVAAINCNTDDDDASNTGNKGNKKRCAAIFNDYGVFVTKCGYSEEEYKALKASFGIEHRKSDRGPR